MKWIKIICVFLLVYVTIAGFLFDVPALPILNEAIRVLFFHVPMWFTMIFLLFISAINSYYYISKGRINYDIKSNEYANVGVFFGILGIISGMLWAKFTWGTYWTNDPKLNGSALGLLIYFSYFVLRGSVKDELKKAKISSVYNIFAFAMLIPLIFILPRMTDSLHPGNGGNPGFNVYDMNSQLRVVFYPSVIGFILLGIWITNIRVRIKFLNK
ncbi:MAG: cytochrome c biogenesis protein CcsA [Bacteroidota bacterium]|uniref:Cytochrome c assembly protein domain-containing protein n=1 Tax=marine metagenome TaxID=408172 RepID=A0A381QQ70_9ZZZZ|nr:cytochrome c biogenesis protein CcsA [Bacteroidota bacterium]|tara:strand:+ start:2556 stop:3197 length:642 start_codon:yes stop_codon:yes gene_type:complete